MFSSLVGGSLANSRLTLSSRGDGGGVQDESVQVDLSAGTITYDSDDEMAKRRSGILLRNKKGHPIYSREDIREQYCITRKEVWVCFFNRVGKKSIQNRRNCTEKKITVLI